MADGKQLLMDALEPVLEWLEVADLASPELADHLEAAFPHAGERVSMVRGLCMEGLEAGWLCDRAAGEARFSRVARTSAETRSFSIDAVLSHGPGVEHTHPRGEVNLCLSVDGAPRFDGHPEGWAAYAPGTRHRPNVAGGTMLLLYFLPDGAIEWHR